MVVYPFPEQQYQENPNPYLGMLTHKKIVGFKTAFFLLNISLLSLILGFFSSVTITILLGTSLLRKKQRREYFVNSF